MRLRIAMWSGPRNLSTAMLRAFENRPDCSVLDEPFYAYYLQRTGLDHPMRDDIIAAQESDPARIIAACTAGDATDPPLQYQKQMCHHMLDEVPTDWLAKVKNCFLIRHPGAVAASYAAKRESVEAGDLGYRRQLALYKTAAAGRSEPPPVLDADDILKEPEAMLRRLCDNLGIGFSEAMLNWPAGPRASDGIWSRHWYGAVEASTGFQTYEKRQICLPDDLRATVARCLPDYLELRALRLKPAG